MDYLDFYKMAKYLNNAWQGCFTEEEIAYNAYEYKVDYDRSISNRKVGRTMESLCNGIVEDIDFMDYEETENNLDVATMERVLREFMEEI